MEFDASAPLRGRVRLESERRDDGRRLVTCCVHNTTELADPDIPRGEALRLSLLSTHVVLRTSAGRFVSPLLERPATRQLLPGARHARADDAVLGAAIVLPDHPQLAPESRGNLFDGTEIEEALLLHVQALSDAEREEIAQQDPAVREMIERAAAATPEDLLRLHGRVTLRDPRDGRGRGDGRRRDLPARRAAWCCGPTPSATSTTACSHGRLATVERIYLDYDDTPRAPRA